MSTPVDPHEGEGEPAPPLVEIATPVLDLDAAQTRLPGAHRGGFARLPTAPIDLTSESAPAEPGTADDLSVRWTPVDPARPVLAAWSLGLGILGLVASLFVGWVFPVCLGAIVCGALAVRRPLESRAVAVWGIALGVAGTLYSAGWLVYAAVVLSH